MVGAGRRPAAGEFDDSSYGHRVRVGRDVDDLPDLGATHRGEFCLTAERGGASGKDPGQVEPGVVHNQFEGTTRADHLVQRQLAGDAAGQGSCAVTIGWIGLSTGSLRGLPAATFVLAGAATGIETTLNCMTLSVRPFIGFASPG